MKIVNVIEKFDGQSDAAKWLERFEAAAIVCELARGDWAAVMPIMVAGAAHDVFSQWSDGVKKDYSRTKQALLNAFSLNPNNAYSALKERKLLPEESVEAFCADIRRLAGLVFKCNGTDPQVEPLIRVAFLDGLPPDVSTQLRTNPATMTAPVCDLVQAASIALPADRVREFVGAAGLSRQNRPRVICFRCRKEGHVQRNCREDPRCFNCNEFGHRRNQCPDSKNGL